MINTATITYHASYNYGSSLQAYALQQIIQGLGVNNEIINLRTENQLRMYNYWCDVPVVNFKSLLRKIYVFPFRKDIITRRNLFESFISKELKLTKEYHSLQELQEANLSYDCFISGGDQIWNTSPYDFDWSYYLPFVKKGKRISYAVSMGPDALAQVSNQSKIQKYLQCYDNISVREQGTKEIVDTLVGIKASIDLDPALLLPFEKWNQKIVQTPIIHGDYILLYSPYYKKSVYQLAELIAKCLKMKVVVTIFSPENRHHNFVSNLATGPWEFLNLTKYAKLVISGSFHALVFSTLFHIPFFAVNGDKDNRMISFLKNLNLEDRTINFDDYKSKVSTAFSIDYSYADKYLEKARLESIHYLKQNILCL